MSVNPKVFFRKYWLELFSWSFGKASTRFQYRKTERFANKFSDLNKKQRSRSCNVRSERNLKTHLISEKPSSSSHRTTKLRVRKSSQQPNRIWDVKTKWNYMPTQNPKRIRSLPNRERNRFSAHGWGKGYHQGEISRSWKTMRKTETTDSLCHVNLSFQRMKQKWDD